MRVNKINLQGDPSADLTINCHSETFRVHKYFLCSKSPVFSAMLNSHMKEAREGEINIKEMNSDTLSSMIHFIYTGELTDSWMDHDTPTLPGRWTCTTCQAGWNCSVLNWRLRRRCLL